MASSTCFCCSLYCFTTESDAPPLVLTKYEFVHKVGNFRCNTGNSWRKKRDERPFTSFISDECQIGVDTHEKMHMIRHHFEFFVLCLVLFKTSRMLWLNRSSIGGRNAPFIPMDQSQGLSGAEMGNADPLLLKKLYRLLFIRLSCVLLTITSARALRPIWASSAVD